MRSVFCLIQRLVLATTYSPYRRCTPFAPSVLKVLRADPNPRSPRRVSSAERSLTSVFGMRTGEKRIHGASQGRRQTCRGGVAEIFSRKLSVTDLCDQVIKFSNAMFWRLPTFPIRVSSAQQSLTSVFGMRTGVTSATNHQNIILENFIWNTVS